MNDATRASDGQHPDPMHAFAELALITVDSDAPEQTLRRVAELAKQTLGAVDDVSVTVIRDGQPRSVTFTGPLAIDLDERQYELGFGPCLDAAKTGQLIVVNHDSDAPYGEFSRIAARAGVRYTASIGMPIAQRCIGGMNLYRKADRAFSAEFLEYAQVFAGYAAVAVNNVTSYADAASEAVNLRKAMETRAAIEQAKGIVMARNRCSADEAFEMLRRISQHRNVKIRELAQSVIDSAQK